MNDLTTGGEPWYNLSARKRSRLYQQPELGQKNRFFCQGR
jgi:hypothetical protein